MTIFWAAQGFEDEVLNVLIKRYPPNLLADLQVCASSITTTNTKIV